MSRTDTTPTSENESESTVRCTRRQFLTGQWFESGADDESTSGSRTEEMSDSCDRFMSKLFRTASITLLAALLLSSVVVAISLAGVSEAATVSEATAVNNLLFNDSSVTSADATSEKQKAKRYLEQLQQLNEAHPEIVDDDVIESVKSNVDHGNSAYDIGKYAEAEASYSRASEQARGALRTYYRQAIQDDLAATSEVIESYGDTDPGQAQKLRNRSNHIRADQENATTARELANIHERAHALNQEADSLGPSLVDRLFGVVPLVFASVVVLLVIYVAFLRHQISTTDQQSDAVAYQTERED